MVLFTEYHMIHFILHCLMANIKEISAHTHCVLQVLLLKSIDVQTA
jgi:hypothetical protein